MAVKDGLPSTDFSRMNRDYIKNLIEESGGSGGGIPAPADPSDGDVLTYSSADDEWVAAAPSGGGGVFSITVASNTFNKTASEVFTAYTNGMVCIVTIVDEHEEMTSYSPLCDVEVTNSGAYSFYVGAYRTIYSASSGSGYPALAE